MAAGHNTISSGREGERLALRYLEHAGMRFIDANWRCKMGEIDLIMQDGSTRVLVEVRRRAPTSYGRGEETVSWHKQQKLIRTAQYYQQTENYWDDIRFDVVSIESASEQHHNAMIYHIRHAFDGS